MSVLFWAPEYYKNYCAFLEQLGIQPATVRVKYLLHTQRLAEQQQLMPPPPAAAAAAAGGDDVDMHLLSSAAAGAGATPSVVASSSGKANVAAASAASSSSSPFSVNVSGAYYAPPDAPDDPFPVSNDMRPSLAKRFEHDLKAFDEMLTFVRACNRSFTGDAQPSFYKNVTLWSRLNPLNYIGIRSLCRASGISDEFFDTILNPYHGIQLTISDIR